MARKKKYIEKIQMANGDSYSINTVPQGGTVGQVLTKSGEDRDSLEWVTPEVYDDTEVVQDIEALQSNKADKDSVYTKEEVYTKQEVETAIQATAVWKTMGE